MAMRRNTITRTDARLVAAVAVVAAVLAALAGCEPTGEPVVDGALTALLGALLTWLAASAAWWALLAGSAVAVAAAIGSPLLVLGGGWIALGAAAWIGARRSSLPVARAAVGGLVVQVALRSGLDGFHGASALAAALSLGLIGFVGWRRRPRHVRRWVTWGAIAVGVGAALAVAGFGLGGARARGPAEDGYQRLLNGLEQLEGGDVSGAAEELRVASQQLRRAESRLGGVLSDPARLVPVVAQHRATLVELAGRAADTAAAAGEALGTVELSQLRFRSGRLDVDALSILGEPLAELDAAVDALALELDEERSPWLVAPLADRLREARGEIGRVVPQADAIEAAARVGPAILGADGPRRYLLAFTNPAEARGTSGVMGSWNELTFDGGALSVTGSGRTRDLATTRDRDGLFELDAPVEWFDRYADFGGDPAGAPGFFWSNVGMTPDLPTAGSLMVQMYEQSTGRALDGVIVVDPAGIAGLLEVVGPVEVPATGRRLTAADVERFLLLEQYETAESDREATLEAVTALVVERLLTTELPEPQDLVEALSVEAQAGHLSAYLVRPEEQALLRAVGMDAALLPAAGADALAVVTNNATAAKIDTFLDRSVTYRVQHEPSTGAVRSEAAVTLANRAPASGYDDYVIGDGSIVPRGTNRTKLSLYSPLTITSVQVDGVDHGLVVDAELGWNVYTVDVDVPPGASVTVTFGLAGNVDPGPYLLRYRGQPSAADDRVRVELDGDVLHEGPLERRSEISARGVSAWR